MAKRAVSKTPSRKKSAQVEYVPPNENQIAMYAYQVCDILAQTDHPAFGESEVRAGFTRFLTCFARIYAKQLTRRAAQRLDTENL